jgi:hypothetical protein
MDEDTKEVKVGNVTIHTYANKKVTEWLKEHHISYAQCFFMGYKALAEQHDTGVQQKQKEQEQELERQREKITRLAFLLEQSVQRANVAEERLKALEEKGGVQHGDRS